MSIALLIQVLGLVLILVAAYADKIRNINVGWLGLFLFFLGSLLR